MAGSEDGITVQIENNALRALKSRKQIDMYQPLSTEEKHGTGPANTNGTAITELKEKEYRELDDQSFL